MPNLRNGIAKGGFEPGLSRLRVRHSTTKLPRSTKSYGVAEKWKSQNLNKISSEVERKVKGSFHIAQYPVRWTAQSALRFLPFLTDLFIPTPTRLLREAF